MTPTLKVLCAAYGANIGRGLCEGEATEFVHKFRNADLSELRKAIDAYFAPAPQFATLPGLEATFRRLAVAATTTGGSPAEDLRSALCWLNGGALERYGFECARTAWTAEDAIPAWRLLVRWHRAWEEGLMVQTGAQARVDRPALEEQLNAIGIHRYRDYIPQRLRRA